MTLVILIAAVLLALYLVWKVRYRYPPREIPQTLCYHKLSEAFLFEGTWMTRRRFVDQVDDLIDRGYRFVDEDTFIRTLIDPAARDCKDILLTFDDGYEELHDVYVEHLEPRGIPVLVFLVTDYVGRPNAWDLSLGRRPARHMGWDQVRALTERGVAFGSHGASHSDLTRLDENALDDDIRRSHDAIARHGGRPARSFSYPFGRYNHRVRAAVRDAGFEAAFSLYPPHSNEAVDRLALRRNGVYIIDTPFTIRCKLTRNPLFWLEEMKCRMINQVAVLTPILKRFSAGPDK
jgi:peptidoglycan/xylan/chitin deacetylase (PgdA/CDA1 family)